MIRVCLVGCCGRMGRALHELATAAEDAEVAAGVERSGHPELGTAFGTGKVTDDLAAAAELVDVVVDFALADGLSDRARTVAAAGRAYVCGVTGLDEAAEVALDRAAELVPVVRSVNFSVGINVLYELAARARRMLGPDYDVEVVETHHRLKQDAPSGTARELVRRLAEATGGATPRYGREGRPGAKPLPEIGVHSIRTGDVIGEHMVVFGGPGERVELAHRATSRQAFAGGALAAARFANGRSPGRYSMTDVLAASR